MLGDGELTPRRKRDSSKDVGEQLLLSFGLLESLLPVGGGEFEEAIVRPGTDEAEQIAEVSVGLDSIPWSRALASSETKVTLAKAPSSLATKSQFRRPRTCRRRSSSLMLLCAGRRPSSRKRRSATRFDAELCRELIRAQPAIPPALDALLPLRTIPISRRLHRSAKRTANVNSQSAMAPHSSI
jgi:hypothetical protein